MEQSPVQLLKSFPCNKKRQLSFILIIFWYLFPNGEILKIYYFLDIWSITNAYKGKLISEIPKVEFSLFLALLMHIHMFGNRLGQKSSLFLGSKIFHSKIKAALYRCIYNTEIFWI